MPCYRPNFVVADRDGNFDHFGGRYSARSRDYFSTSYSKPVPVPCGKCVGCRLDRSKYWAERMLLEYNTRSDSIPFRTALFLTLTYDDDHISGIICDDDVYRYNLVPDDLSKFWKRLRKRDIVPKFKYYASGEYGDLTFRPHYHVILFGFSLSDFPDSFLYSKSSRTGDPLFESPFLDAIWSHGAVRFSDANFHTFAYVGRYILKKQFGSDSRSFYRGRCPPFVRMSLKPGIGLDYFGTDWSDQKAVVSDGSDVYQIGIPRVVLDKIHVSDPELYDVIKKQRAYIAEGRQALLDQSIGKDYFTYLNEEEHRYFNRMKLLHKRSAI